MVSDSTTDKETTRQVLGFSCYPALREAIVRHARKNKFLNKNGDPVISGSVVRILEEYLKIPIGKRSEMRGVVPWANNKKGADKTRGAGSGKEPGLHKKAATA